MYYRDFSNNIIEVDLINHSWDPIFTFEQWVGCFVYLFKKLSVSIMIFPFVVFYLSYFVDLTSEFFPDLAIRILLDQRIWIPIFFIFQFHKIFCLLSENSHQKIEKHYFIYILTPHNFRTKLGMMIST